MNDWRDVVESVLTIAAQAIKQSASNEQERAWLEAAVRPAFNYARQVSHCPMVWLPLEIARGLGGAEGLARRLAAACLLFFASADVIDDAQDGDFSVADFGNWQSAVNAGNALIFIAMATAQGAVIASRQGLVGAAFSRAGVAMCQGQQRDLLQRGDPGPHWSEDDYLACLRGKAGGSFRLYASVGALAVGADPRVANVLGQFGESLGMAVQLASDLADLQSDESSDRRNKVITLPVADAWHRMSEDERPLLIASWRGEPDALPLVVLLERSGAMSYADLRLAVLRTEATMGLEQLGMPDQMRDRLNALVNAVDWRGPTGLA